MVPGGGSQKRGSESGGKSNGLPTPFAGGVSANPPGGWPVGGASSSFPSGSSPSGAFPPSSFPSGSFPPSGGVLPRGVPLGGSGAARGGPAEGSKRGPGGVLKGDDDDRTVPLMELREVMRKLNFTREAEGVTTQQLAEGLKRLG